MVKHTQTIRRQIIGELFECVWPFCGIDSSYTLQVMEGIWPLMFRTTHCTMCRSSVGYSISRKYFFLNHITNKRGNQFMLCAIAKSWSDIITLYFIHTKNAERLLATARLIGTLVLSSCQWNITWPGPRIPAKSSSALISEKQPPEVFYKKRCC